MTQEKSFPPLFVAFEASPWTAWNVIGIATSYEQAMQCIDKHYTEFGHRSIYRIVPCELNGEPVSLQPMSTPEVKPTFGVSFNMERRQIKK